MSLWKEAKKAAGKVADVVTDVATGGITNVIGAAASALIPKQPGINEATGLPEAGPSRPGFDEKAAALNYEQSQRQQRASAASAVLSDNAADELGQAPAGPKRRSASRTILG